MDFNAVFTVRFTNKRHMTYCDGMRITHLT